MPSRDGRSSFSSMNSPRQIFSANLFGMGGECKPTETAWHGSSLVGEVSIESGRWSAVIGVTVEFVVTVVADPSVPDEKVCTFASASGSGMRPTAELLDVPVVVLEPMCCYNFFEL